MEYVINTMQRLLPTIISQVTADTRAAQLDLYAGGRGEEIERFVTIGMRAFYKDLEVGGTRHFELYWERAGEVQGRRDTRIEELLHAANVAQLGLNNYMVGALSDDPQALTWWLNRNHEITYAAVASLARVYLRTREQTIQEQAEQLRELAAPVIQLYHGILLLPLIGSLDERRVAAVMETLLDSIGAASASVVIIDITGVPIVDTAVANALVMVARAARLLGAQVLLVGIGAEIAQALVQLGAELSGLITLADLQAGLERAFTLLGLAIRPA